MDLSKYKKIELLEEGIGHGIFYIIPTSEAEIILREFEWNKLEVLEDRFIEFYQLSNGVILEYYKPRPVLYENLDMLRLIQKISEASFQKTKERIQATKTNVRAYINANYERIRYKELTKEEKDTILESAGDQVTILSQKEDEIIYALPEGQIMELDPNEYDGFEYFCYLFDSNEDYEDYKKRYEGTFNKSLLWGLNPYNEDFPDAIDTLIKFISNSLGIPLELLDKSPKSLNHIDRKLERLYSDDFYLDHALAFTAYLGEVVIHSHGGKWVIQLDDDGQTWLPLIQLSSGKRYDMYFDLYEWFHRDEEEFIVLLSYIYSDFVRRRISK